MQSPSHRTIQFLTWSPLFFVPAIVIMVLLLLLQSYDQHFEETISTLESELIESENQALEARVNGVVEWVDYQQSIIEQNLTHRVQDRVDSAYKIATEIIEQYRDSKSPEDIQKMITTTLRPLVWNGGESFIWILDYDGVFKLAPTYLRHLEGKSILDFKDANGRYIIQEEIKISQTKGQGFLWDTFTKPNDPSGKQYEQVAFVKALGHYNWYLGSGEYLITASTKTNEELLNSIDKIGSEKNYLFVLSAEGKSILNRSIAIDRKKIDPEEARTQAIVKDHLDTLDKNDSIFLSYEWINPETNQTETKYSYLRKTAAKNWLIGSGFYASEVRKKADQEAVKIHEDYRNQITTFLMLSVIWLFVALIIGFWLTRYIGNYFQQYQRRIQQQTDELKQFNDQLEQKILDRTSELEESKKAYETLAKTDALTGTNNRYATMNALENEMKRAQRTLQPLSVIMFDIDYFKTINDQYGHDVGDDVLRIITQTIITILREIDTLGRYGGDEFIIILPATSLADAVMITERIRSTIETHRFHNNHPVTISAGIVEYSQDESQDELFKRLDEKLYESKNARNRVSV